jgi:hypothetical protein
MFSIYLFKDDGSRIFQVGAGTFDEAYAALEVLEARFPGVTFRVL